MNKHDLLLEIGLEEIPARYCLSSMNQLQSKMEEFLKEQNIEFTSIESFATPRRLTVLVREVSDKQNDIHEEVKGPSKKVALDGEGNWTKAAIGFTRGQGKTSEDIYFKEINGVEYVHIEKYTKGEETIKILGKLDDLITSLSFPKNMRWADLDLRYIRPIRWVVALFGSEVIPLNVGEVTSGRETYGHRFLGDKVEIQEPKDYVETMRKQFVIVDPTERKNMILQQIKDLEDEKNWVIPVDEELLEEVTFLVEYPTVLYGSFEEEFLRLPKEVLITTMKEHQRYFPVTVQEGNLLAHFVTVRNGNAEHLETVRRGNEKVLRARLSDAVFFYEEDQNLSIQEAIDKLSTVVYHEEIGTYKEKLVRIKNLAQYIIEQLHIQNEASDILRAAQICKFDLVTQMVGEFPELQGIMGEQYAKIAGENENVALAINEHYMPRNAEGDIPKSLAGKVVSLSDKLDTLASFFAIGLIPTGSQDPYSLRRLANGVVQILINSDWDLNFVDLLKVSIEQTQSFKKKEDIEILNDLNAFFDLRMKYLLNENQIRYDIIDALLESPKTNLRSILTKAEILQEEKDKDGFKENIESLARVINISSKCEEITPIHEELFENEHEVQLYSKYKELQALFNQLIDEKQQYYALVALKQPITNYFDHTMVMVDDTIKRQNRLSLLKLLSEIILQFAHFQFINVK